MWAILKFDKKNLESLKKDFSDKLGKDYIIYIPKLIIQRYKNNKLINKEYNLLGDYLFCFHNNLKNSKIMSTLQYSRGLKYFLEGNNESQDEISKFIKKCKNAENKKGYICQDFFEININSKFKFNSGPFTDMIFKIIELQKNKIKILMGNLKTIINKQEFIFTPL